MIWLSELSLWQFNEDFVKAVDSAVYEKYSREYDEYMRAAFCDEEPEMEL